MKTQSPPNQKALYHSFSDMFQKIMNDEISLEKAETAVKYLNGMNKTYALELKRAELQNQLKGNSVPTEIRTIELKAFDEIPIDE